MLGAGVALDLQLQLTLCFKACNACASINACASLQGYSARLPPLEPSCPVLSAAWSPSTFNLSPFPLHDRVYPWPAPAPWKPAAACSVPVDIPTDHQQEHSTDGAASHSSDTPCSARVLAWLEHRLRMAPEHLTQRHDNLFLLLFVLASPIWFTLPFGLVLWGHFSAWRVLYWVPAVVFSLTMQVMGFCSLWHPADDFFLSRRGLILTGIATGSYSVFTCGPLALQPTCGAACVPLNNVLVFTAACLFFTVMQVRDPSLSCRNIRT